MNKLILAGSAGMLGSDIYRSLHQSNECFVGDIDRSDDHVLHLDFRNGEEYRAFAREINPDVLLHIGAHTDLEYCETNVTDCYQTNTSSVEHAVGIANQLKIKLVYISTAGIFDGKLEFYNDYDTPNPLGNYAKSKFYGERHIELHCNDYLIVRAGWMMGGGLQKDKKFIGKIMRQINSGSRTLNIVNDKLGTPTYTRDFANNLKHLISEDAIGKFNMVCGGLTSRMEVAQFVCDYLGKHAGIRVNINEVDSTFFKNEYFSPRPDNERLVNRRLIDLNLNLMRDWQSALYDYLGELVK